MLTALMARNGASWPAKPAVVQGERRITHEELTRETASLAARLRELGVGPGDTVAIVLPNCPEFTIAFFAVMRVHAIAMPLNPHYTAAERDRFLSRKAVRAIIADASTAAACDSDSALPIIVANERGSLDPMSGDEDTPYSGDALYLFTSGSTGGTKRVLFTQENLFWEARNFVDSTGIGPDDPILCPVPLYHSYGLCLGMLDATYTGATLVLEPDPDAPFPGRCSRMLELLREENIRVLPAVPWQFAILADFPADVRESFRDVKWCMSSGDRLPRRTYNRFFERTGRRIRSFYGSTEAGSVTMETGPEEAVEFESVGGPLRNVSIAIRDQAGVAAATGQTGEIWIQSPAVASGYDDDAALSAAVFRDGWYNSGDLGHVDARGRLFLSGRKQSIISAGSYKVDAVEVEEVLLEMHGVREAAVVGVEVPIAGTMVKAVLVTAGGIRESDVRHYCRQRLALFKIPRIIEFISELPRDPMGKILKKDLASAEQYVRSIRDAATVGLVRQIERATAARKRTLIQQIVERQAAAVLGRSGVPIPRDVGFVDLGLDSFGSMELVTRLELLFGSVVSQTFTFDHPTIDAATDELVAIVGGTRHEKGAS